jgi:Coenzyme PQQ synthesis protein D (PqqD)
MNIDVDRICVNEPEIASKIMDGEAILINLQSGAYYSLRHAGAVVWQALRGHRTRDEVLQVVAVYYGEHPAHMESDISELLGRLQEENLVRVSEHDRAVDAEEALLPASATYQKPSFEKFSDMADLLALDPPTPGALDSLMRQPLARRDD